MRQEVFWLYIRIGSAHGQCVSCLHERQMHPSNGVGRSLCAFLPAGVALRDNSIRQSLFAHRSLRQAVSERVASEVCIWHVSSGLFAGQAGDMARTKQTVRRPRKQSHARNGSTEALPPSTLVENNYRIAGDGILERDSDCAESPAELEPVSGAKASSLSQLIEDEDMPEHDQDRLPYLPSFKLLGFEKDIRIHIHKWGPPRRAWYCLDCVRMHLIAWCDGTFEELAKDCEFHEVK